MRFRKLIRFIWVFACIYLLLLATLAASGRAQSNRGEPSAEVRNKLFKQVLEDMSDFRECVQQAEGGISAAQENASFEEFDLNRDGVKEYQVELSGCGCAAHNCSIYLYRHSGPGYEQILDGSGMGLEVLKTSTNGYADVRVGARDTAATESETTYKFDGKEYRESKTMLVHLETGETKPAHRRVQFKRGSSSTTLTGRASLALPDTWLIGARTGQVMTVQLTAARKAVRFMVMSPTTRHVVADNVRNWTGPLPESGDYYIIVDSDERPSTYSLTVSIK
jgi:hypothetical protein